MVLIAASCGGFLPNLAARRKWRAFFGTYHGIRQTAPARRRLQVRGATVATGARHAQYEDAASGLQAADADAGVAVAVLLPGGDRRSYPRESHLRPSHGARVKGARGLDIEPRFVCKACGKRGADVGEHVGAVHPIKLGLAGPGT